MTTSSSRLITDFGAKGDGLSDDGDAFQRALVAGSGTVVVPAGRYLIGRTLRVPGGVHLKLDAQAVMKLADGVAKTNDDYLLTNANPTTGDADILIEGGLWDGNNRHNARPTGLFDVGCSGAMLHFRNVKGLRLRDLHLRNAEAYHARFTEVHDFLIEKIRFSSDNTRHNNDGIHLGGNCSHGVIRDIKGLHPGVTGDDMVALNADDALNRTEVLGMTGGPIRDIVIEDIEAEGCHSFVRLLSVYSTIENIRIRGVRGTCDIAALNCDAARGCRVPVFDEKNPPFPDGVGLLRNIDAADFHVAKSSANGIALLRLETRMENFRVADFHRDFSRDRDPTQPAMRLRYAGADSLILDADAPRTVPFGECLEVRDLRHLVVNPPKS